MSLFFVKTKCKPGFPGPSSVPHDDQRQQLCKCHGSSMKSEEEEMEKASAAAPPPREESGRRADLLRVHRTNWPTFQGRPSL